MATSRRELDCPRGCGGILTVVDTGTALSDGTTHWAVTKVIGCTHGCSEWMQGEVPNRAD